MKRRAFNVVAASSLLASVVLTACGATSHGHHYYARYYSAGRTCFALNCSDGQLFLDVTYSAWFPQHSRWFFRSDSSSTSLRLPDDTMWQRLGLFVTYRTFDESMNRL